MPLVEDLADGFIRRCMLALPKEACPRETDPSGPGVVGFSISKGIELLIIKDNFKVLRGSGIRGCQV